LFYIGPCPPKEYFNTTEEYYSFYKENPILDFKKISIEYCENDVILTARIIKNIRNIVNNINTNFFDKCYSAPALAYKIFFKKYNTFNIKQKTLKEDADYIRKSYYGGRCEIFGNVQKDELVNYFDFSGMYGQCMLENFHNGEGRFNKISCNYDEIGFHTIKYLSDSDIPLLPYHAENKKLIFPNGIIIGTFWFEEIIEFVKNGGVVLETISSYTYEKCDPVFKDFIHYFNQFREQGGYFKIFGKLIINSLYGGFALEEDNFFTTITFSEKEFQTILEHTNVKK